MNGEPMHSATPTTALMDLLLGLFSEDELRSFVAHRAPGGDRIAHLMPGSPCPYARLADETARLLDRKGLVTPALFDALRAAVPGRHGDIEGVAAAWGLASPGRPAAVAASPTSPAQSPAESESWDVFVAYAGSDRAWVETLVEGLHGHGLRVFFDEWEIGPGDVIAQRLDQGLRDSRSGILVVSSDVASRPWLLAEYAALLTRAVVHRLRLIPVLCTDADVPPLLATYSWVDLRGKTGEAYAESLARLVRALRGERPGPPARRP
jgi:hypothetical protein